MSDTSDCPKAVRDWLQASDAISNAVGSRIYADVMPQGETRDRINISKISFTPEYGLAGECGNGTSVIQLDYWSQHKDAVAHVKDGGQMIRNRISGYRGPLNEHVFANSCILLRGPEETASAPTDASGIFRRRSTIDVEIIHTTAVPTFA